ncbi:CBS domain-containing protein [Leptolyngbya cf. ectocarpi LEGE 11479]|uniref:histidine kinase n=1 Tax=Leptolyngbya cf. ectocarpi LEGE 11479 TaxID=1828722 RepID=A0A928ZTZ5_LEPEC|nr:CBS domain-containing protein [Leptolyngbya ectocarpi]MBE9067408.1 CBS domain-containing protein [Leptolyngbya cf. ectocarpi LEGE 11479]
MSNPTPLMLAQAIDSEPLIVEPSTLLRQVISLLNQARSHRYSFDEREIEATPATKPKRSSCALIMKDGDLLGIFTERDLVKLIANGEIQDDLTVADVMTQPAISLKETGHQDIFVALNLIREHQIRHLPILDEHDQLLGIVTPRSIREVLDPTDLLKIRRVSEIMSLNVVHTPPTSSVMEVAKLMNQHLISCVVIVEVTPLPDSNPDSSCLCPIGIITERDIVQFRAMEFNLDQLEAQAVMSAPLFLVNPDDSLWSVNQKMKQHLTRRLVVAGPQGELQGIITQTNILQVLDPIEMYSVIELLQHKLTELEAENIRLLQNCTLQLEQEIATKENERQHTQQTIRAQAALLDVTTDAIMVRSPEHQILFWNRGAEHLYGWTADEVMEKDADQLLYGASLPELADIQTALEQTGQWQGELQQTTKTGQTITVASRWTRMQDDTGYPQSTLVVNTDITDKKQLERQFLRAQRLESIGSLAGGIAHDLNNILTPVLGVAKLLPMLIGKDDTQALRLVNLLQSSTQRGVDIINQVLSFSRGLEGERSILQAKHLIREVIQIAQQTFPKSISINERTEADLWTVYGDATQLHQVLMNLCVNARDAMPSGGKLTVVAQNFHADHNYARINLEANEGPYLLISVEDSGVGISPDIIEQIFDPFFTTKESGKGTGLGLSTVISIIKSHGGYLKVYSEPGQGSRFQVYLPAVETPEALPTVEENLPQGQGELIFVVDDEAPIREVTKRWLEAYNYRVLTACDGIDAIATYAEHKQEIAVVLMDMMMPQMDGTTAINSRFA